MLKDHFSTNQSQIRPMNNNCCIVVLRTALGLTFAVFTGWLLGELSWSLAVFSTTLLAWHTYQLYKLQRWLFVPKTSFSLDSIGVWGVVFDNISRQQARQQIRIKNLKEVLERVQASTAALRDGVLMVNSRGELEWWNEAANTLLGLNKQDKRQAVSNYVSNPDFKAYFDSADYSKPLEITSPIHRKKTLEFQITLFGRKDRLIVCKDISQWKQLESVRQDFIANVSHELRTPLTVFTGYLETFIDYKEELPVRWERPLLQMNQQSMRMRNLVNDLLLLSKLESKDQIQHTSVCLKTLLSKVLNDAKAFSAGKHTINMDCEYITMRGIEMELSSAFSNVIFNAVKYTPENGSISIRCFKGENSLNVIVTDNGIGIDAIHISRLTERFYRADPSRHSDSGGTGLGLAIVKHILLRHGGHLHIESEIGIGSTFTCHLPLDRIM